MFKSQNFCHIASNNRNLVKVGVFTYRTTDSLDKVLASGYFNERIIDINLHDLIIHERINIFDSTIVERNMLCVVERTLDNVGTTLIQSDWEKDTEQAIEDILDQLDNFVKLDGTSVMTGNLQTPNVRLTGKGGITAKVGSSNVNLIKLNNDVVGKVEVGQDSVPTQVSSATFTHKISGVDYKVLDNKDAATPVSNINKVITQTEQQILDNKIDTAANSGDQLYDTGVWYAKMYAGTTPPASVEGRNYADFSQTDGSGNPVIKIYTYTSGSWTLTETIVPPTEYNGYMTITSKIWDISEQAGQQGGKVLWSHNQRTFTPYPQIISFDGANITNGSFQGVATLSDVSTAPTPTDASPNTQIATKEYVDSHSSAGGYHPDLFEHKWADHQLNDVQWLRADTFSWQSGSVYQAAYKHLRNDMYNWYSWKNNGTTIYTKKAYPEVGEKVYSNSALTTEVGEITAVTDTLDITVEKITVNNVVYDSVSGSSITPTTETVGGITVHYIPAEDGHKIVTSFDENEVADIYAATGVAWYYIIDYGNRRFKLPRTQFGFTGLRDTVGKYVEASIPNLKCSIGINEQYRSNGNLAIIDGGDGFAQSLGNATGRDSDGSSGQRPYGFSLNASRVSSVYKDGATTVQQPATQMYLYFYVGQFTQSAIEQTAGLNAELFNEKADLDLSNANISATFAQLLLNAGIDVVIEKQLPTAENNYTWYRKYKSGWVEQGGCGSTTAGNSFSATYPITMLNTNYTLLVSGSSAGATTSSTAHGCHYTSKTATGCVIMIIAGNSGNWVAGTVNWQASGMAA